MGLFYTTPEPTRGVDSSSHMTASSSASHRVDSVPAFRFCQRARVDNVVRTHSLTHSLTACRWPQSQEETGNNLPLVYRNRRANITQMQQGFTSHSTQNRSLQQTNKHSVYKRPDSNSCIDLRTVRSIRMLAAAWFFSPPQ